MPWVLPKKYGEKGKPKGKIEKKNGMNHNRKKNKMQRRVWTKDQNKTSTVTGKKGEKEKWKIRKKYCSLPKLTHVAERMVFMFTLSQLATHSSMPPVMPHMLRRAFLRSKLNMKNHGVWPSHRCLGDGENSGGYEADSWSVTQTQLIYLGVNPGQRPPWPASSLSLSNGGGV